MRWMSVVASLSVACGACAGPLYRGFSYTPWWRDALLGSASDQSILNMKAVGVDTVALNFWWFQDNETSTVITEDFTKYSASQPSILHAIQFMHANGLKVMLKPMVDLRNGSWRGNIVPSAAWFAAYQNFVVYWATIAEQQGVEAFCIGCEYIKTDSWATQWRQLAAAVRGVYSGRITYAANHGNEDVVKWWDAVDFIGIDAYYSLTSKNNPTLAELKTAWSNRRNSIRNWRNSKWPTKQVSFTEVGYRSADGTNKAPWDYSSAWALDLQEQADCYEALFSAMWNEGWWDGAFLWNWETDPNAGGQSDKGYTPHNKPAEQILASYYLLPKTATVAGSVTLEDFVGDVSGEAVQVEMRTPGTATVVETRTSALGATGAFSFETEKRGAFDLAFRGRTWLRRVVPNVTISDAGVVDLAVSLPNGDVDGDDAVTVFDYNALSDAFDTASGEAGWNANADLDGDGAVTVFDYNVLSANFDLSGE